jgi:UDP-2,4-diacetamido-2,4,6-trideoxy-beta-L-altropyranose hydrolase
VTERCALLRVDASVEIGTGHFMRCRTLADELIDHGWSVTLASRDLPDDLARSIGPSGIETLRIPQDVGIADEPDWLKPRLATDHPLLVVDHYRIGSAWLQRARAWTTIIVAIDDLGDRPLPVDLVVNQNLGAEEARYRSLVPTTARILVGPTFALLRPEFAAAHDRRRTRSGAIDRILVFMSGADVPDTTRRAAEAAAAVGAQVDVVVGAVYPHLPALRRWAAGQPSVELHVNTSAMAALMERADLAIGAPSSASWERCAVGLPSILVVLADNQRETGRLLAEHGAALTLGWHTSIDTDRIERAIRTLRTEPARVRDMSSAAGGITDGRGTERIIVEIETLVDSSTGDSTPS